MSQVTEAMHEHHQELLAYLSEQARLLTDGSAAADPTALASFLTNDLLPHAAGEERALYPVVEPLLKTHGTATATMSVDHQVFGEHVKVIGELARALAAADSTEHPALQSRLARATLQLEAIFRLYLRKEESVYLPLFEQYVTPEVQQQVLDAMHEAAPESAADTIQAHDDGEVRNEANR
jgi:iron-sulfur cluster repair protein YtfE (RIC family)